MVVLNFSSALHKTTSAIHKVYMYILIKIPTSFYLRVLLISPCCVQFVELRGVQKLWHNTHKTGGGGCPQLNVLVYDTRLKA